MVSLGYYELNYLGMIDLIVATSFNNRMQIEIWKECTSFENGIFQ